MSKKLKYLVPVVLAAAVLIFAEWLLFRFVYRDTLFLVKMSEEEEEFGEEERARVTDIHRETMQRRRPGTRNLILLADIMVKMKEDAEASELMRVLLERYPDDLGLRWRHAGILGRLGKHEESGDEYAEILRRMEQRPGRYGLREGDVLLAAARSSVGAGQLDVALNRFEQAVRLMPKELPVREEYAGLLVSAGRPEEAKEHYRTLIDAEPTHPDYRIDLF